MALHTFQPKALNRNVAQLSSSFTEGESHSGMVQQHLEFLSPICNIL